MTVPETFRLIRAEDHVVLDVVVTDLVPVAVVPTRDQPSPFVLRTPPSPPAPPNQVGTLRVRFPAQQLVEYATPFGGTRTIQPKPILTSRTEVVVKVPAGDPGIPLSVAGNTALADAGGRLDLVTRWGSDPLEETTPSRSPTSPPADSPGATPPRPSPSRFATAPQAARR